MAIWTAIFPSDVIKSRIQIGTSGMDTSLSFVGMVRKVAKEEGGWLGEGWLSGGWLGKGLMG